MVIPQSESTVSSGTGQMMVSPYRIKPRKCPHVFHIECLLQWWTEGTCPVRQPRLRV